MPVAINVTESAKLHFTKCLAEAPKTQAVRLGVKKSGCSGYAYHLELAEPPEPQAYTLAVDNIPFIIDEASQQFLQGIEIDYVREGLSGFIKFNNPNAKATCGCGESFNIDN